MQKGGTKGGSGPRIKISPARLTGKITDWKGTFGWIQPDKPINHPQAKFHRGLIHLAQADVEAEISGIGASVSYFCYADGTGLGATNCRPVAGVPPVQLTVTKPAAKPAFPGAAAFMNPAAFVGAAAALAKAAAAGKAGGKASGKAVGKSTASAVSGQKTRVSGSPVTGQVKSYKSGPGGFGWITPLEPVKHPLFRGQIYVKDVDIVGGKVLQPGMTVVFNLYADSQGLGAEMCRVTDESGVQSAAAASGATPAPTVEERERITVVPMTGDVLDWKGSFGWVKPHVPVDHPEGKKRQGNVYVSKRDLKGISSLQVGQLVQFHVFVDSSGIGGDECMLF